MRTTILSKILFMLVLLAGASATPAQEPVDADTPPLVQQAVELEAALAEGRTQGEEADAEESELEGRELEVLRARRTITRLEFLENSHALADNLLAQEAEGLDTTELRPRVEALMGEIATLFREAFDRADVRLAEFTALQTETPPEEIETFEADFTVLIGQIDRVFDLYQAHADKMEAIGLDASEVRADLASRLAERAVDLQARIELVRQDRASLSAIQTQDPDDPELVRLGQLADLRMTRWTTSLGATVDMMDAAGMDSAEYRQLLIETTGQISKDILDTDVAIGLLGRSKDRMVTWFSENAPAMLFNTVVFVFVLLVFWLASRIVRKVVARAVRTSRLNLSQLLQTTIVHWSARGVMLLGLLIALSQLGFSIGPLLAGLGVAGIIIGFALQDTLSNFASGVMILVYRPYDVGDMIEGGGVFGQVNQMNLVSTTILTIDNETLIVPNSKIWGDVIKNRTAQNRRRVDMTFGISYSDDIPHAERVLMSILQDHDRVLEDPEPMVRLHRLGESSVDFIVRPWVRTDDYWDVYWDVTREVKMRFDHEGISIPFPQRDVHVHRDGDFEAPPEVPAPGPGDEDEA